LHDHLQHLHLAASAGCYGWSKNMTTRAGSPTSRACLDVLSLTAGRSSATIMTQKIQTSDSSVPFDVQATGIESPQSFPSYLQKSRSR
jgi:hypothetical protein